MAAILMVPGLFGNKGVWSKVASFFSGLGFDCHPVTLPLRRKLAERPSSRLGKISAKDDICFLQTKIAEIRKGLGKGEQLIGMGHSRGVLLILMLQQIFAEEGKKLFDKIVLITPAPPKGIKALSWSGLKGYLCLRPIYWFLKKPVKRTFTGMAYAVMDEAMAAQDKMRLYNGLSWESGKVVFETLFHPPEVDPGRINCPVLVIGGSQDRLIPPAVARQIAKMLGADYREVDGPHLLLKGSAQEKLCQTILNWLWGIKYPS